MKLLLEGSLVPMSELAGLGVLARYTEIARQMHPTAAQESFTIVASDDGEAHRWVEWNGSSSCSVREVQRAGGIVEVNSPSGHT
jgi:hypothetical protein